LELESRVPSRKPRQSSLAVRWLLLIVLLIGLDQITKLIITNQYTLGEQTVLTSWFNIVRVHNTGAAFSFLADAGGWQRWFFISLGVAAVGILGTMLWRQGHQTMFAIAATLIISGAIGNTIDRSTWGYVVDFIDWHYAGLHWPAFNLADSYITIGAVTLVLDEIRRVRRG
jgi:signal peptidase II